MAWARWHEVGEREQARQHGRDSVRWEREREGQGEGGRVRVRIRAGDREISNRTGTQ